jgi:hypothetical protein
MRPHPRIRKTIKWGGAAVTVLLVVVWIGSGWWYVEYCNRPNDNPNNPNSVSAAGGCLLFQIYTPAPEKMVDAAALASADFFMPGSGPAPGPWHWGRHGPTPAQPRFAYWCSYAIYGSPKYGVLRWIRVPLWWLALPALLATLTAWRVDTLARRRARLNLCPKCNYDRAGIGAGAVCPECGASAPSSA